MCRAALAGALLAALIACGGMTSTPGGYSVSDDTIQLPLWCEPREVRALFRIADDLSPCLPAGVSFAAFHAEATTDGPLSVVDESVPGFGACALTRMDASFFVGGDPSASVPPGSRCGAVFGYPEQRIDWSQLKRFLPPPNRVDRALEALDDLFMPEGHL